MATIDVKYTLQSMPLEKFYADHEAAARGLASAMDDAWEADLAPLKAEGHEVIIDVTVVDKITGGQKHSPTVSIFMENWDVRDELALEHRVSGLLTDTNTLRENYRNAVQATA